MKVLNFYHIGKKIPDNAVYIGRENIKHNLKQSKFANPFPINELHTRDEVIEAYRKWLWQMLNSGVITKQDILELEGKDLVCYCNPHPCHGDVLLNAFRYYKEQNN